MNFPRDEAIPDTTFPVREFVGEARRLVEQTKAHVIVGLLLLLLFLLLLGGSRSVATGSGSTTGSGATSTSSTGRN